MSATMPKLLPLREGERLDADEFFDRYEAMPEVKKAELIEGVVHMSSPVSTEGHAEPHADLGTWLGMYRIDTPGVRAGDNPTVRIGPRDTPQPDNTLRIEGGQARIVRGFMESGPELTAEVAASSASTDRNAKFRTYRAAGVLEYILFRTEDGEVDWFILRDGDYQPLAPGSDGILRSETFPGLWLDPAALAAGDMRRVRAVLNLGIATPEHAAFVADLRKRAAGS